MQPQEPADEQPQAAIEGGVAVEIIAVAIPAIGASGEDDIDKHGHAFLKTERYAGPGTGGRRTASCGECEEAIVTIMCTSCAVSMDIKAHFVHI